MPFRAPLFKNFDNFKDRRNNYKAYEKNCKLAPGQLNFNESTSQFNNSRFKEKDDGKSEEDDVSVTGGTAADRKSIQHYIYGYIPKYDLHNYNLNLDRNLVED